MTLAQTVFYYRTYPNDTKIIKCLVSVTYASRSSSIAHHRHGDRFALFGRTSVFHETHVVSLTNSIRSASILDTVHVCLICDSFWDLLIYARPSGKSAFTKLSWSVPQSYLVFGLKTHSQAG